jgi:Subtilase family
MSHRRRRAVVVAVSAVTALGGMPAVGAISVASAAGRSTTTLSAADAAKLSQDATHKVIVLLRNQPAMTPMLGAAASTRKAQVAAAQAPIASELRRTSRNVRSYQLVNAVAATVSAAEEARLRANPVVASVIQDEVIHGPSSSATATPSGIDPTRPVVPGACPTGSTPLLEPEALQVTHTDSDNPTDKTARSLGYTGKGVKVAYMAEGIDINNPDFIRADGSHVFVDYKDFSSDGINAPTAAGEAFLDASAIAAQGRHTYNIQNFSAIPLAHSCTIRIEGMAPGVSLVGLKVFASNNATLTSAFLQAIDYAVTVAHVDVLNESFGGNPYPDAATADAVAMFDEAAVKAGVTVTASSGDAGPTNTIGSPATDPAVISVGGSTTFRFYAETGYGGFAPLANGGWLNDNISSLSSSGLSQAGRTIDMVAPGDLSFALCTPDLAKYADCTTFAGAASPVEESGGTSESAPLTAGAAALVIEAYRHSHGGASPSPALVKQLLTSTADDLGHPAEEQGAGRLDSYQAVLAARSVHDAKGSPAATGSTVLSNQTQLDATGLPGTPVSQQLQLTNNGSVAQTLALHERTLGPAQSKVTGSVTLSDAKSRHFIDFAGQTTNFAVVHFTVKPGQDRLDADYVYPGDPSLGNNQRVRLALIDPNGDFAAHSLPQGVGNAGHVDVRYPVAGTWTAMIWSRSSAVDGTVGKIRYQFVTHVYQTVGSVTPSSATLQPGRSQWFTVKATTPGKPGDQANSVEIDSSTGPTTSVPVALRSLADVNHGGAFSGVLTGGNGRSFNTGQTGYVQFDVPAGVNDVTANFRLADNSGDPVFGYLIDPAGNAQAYSANAQVIGFDTTGNPVTKQLRTMSLFARAPSPGRWTLILVFAPTVTGTQLAEPFSGHVVLNQVRVSAPGVPDNASVALKAGKPVTVPVTVKNTGVAPESFFVDARLDGTQKITLAQLAPSPFALPLVPTSFQPQWNVPTETSKVTVAVVANVPVNFDYGWLFGFGDPDVSGTSSGKTAVGSFSGNPVPSGSWFASPAEIGPFGPNGAPPGSAVAALTATTRPFDPAVTTPIGDFELGSVDPSTPFALVTVKPGQSLTIPVTITPTGKKGSVVSGQLFVDDLSFVTLLGALPAGQELGAVPYRYTIG